MVEREASMEERAATCESECKGETERHDSVSHHRACGRVDGRDNVDRSAADKRANELKNAVEREGDAAAGTCSEHLADDRKGGDTMNDVCGHFELL